MGSYFSVAPGLLSEIWSARLSKIGELTGLGLANTKEEKRRWRDPKTDLRTPRDSSTKTLIEKVEIAFEASADRTVHLDGRRFR